MSLEFNTGDLVLYTGEEWISWAIEKITFSPYSHVGMIVIDPYLLFPEREDMRDKKGIFILESSYEPDLKNFLGVQLYPLEKTHGIKWHRRLILKSSIPIHVLKMNIEKVLGKRYDFFDLIEAEFHITLRKRYDKEFFCSSLVAYLYCNFGLLSPNIDWNMYLPKNFSSGYITNLYENKGRLEKEEKI